MGRKGARGVQKAAWVAGKGDGKGGERACKSQQLGLQLDVQQTLNPKLSLKRQPGGFDERCAAQPRDHPPFQTHAQAPPSAAPLHLVKLLHLAAQHLPEALLRARGEVKAYVCVWGGGSGGMRGRRASPRGCPPGT